MEMMIRRPAYVGRFVCDGARCGSRCCRLWGIPIDGGTRKRWRQLMTGAEYRESMGRLDKSGDVYTIHMEEGRCPFLREDALCSLQRAHGAEILSNVCYTFPREVTRMGEHLFFEALSMTCPVAQEAALFDGPMTFETVADDPSFRAYDACHRSVHGEGFVLSLMDASSHLLLDDRLTLREGLAALGFFWETMAEQLEEVGEENIVLPEGALFLPEEAQLLADSIHSDRTARMRQIFSFLHRLAQADIEDVLHARSLSPEGHEEMLLFFPLVLAVYDVQNGPLELGRLAKRNEALEEELLPLLAPYEGAIAQYLVNSLYVHGFPQKQGGDLRIYFVCLAALYSLLLFFLGAFVAQEGVLSKRDFMESIAMLDGALCHHPAFGQEYLAWLTAEQKPLADWMGELL